MTKPELVKLIMENTDTYKKTHLMDKHKPELEVIAAALMTTKPHAAACETEISAPVMIPDSSAEAQAARLKAAQAGYDEHCSIVKGPRMDKAEFRKTVIETALARLNVDADPDAIKATVLDTMTELLNDKAAFNPINDTERLMLATIPQLPDFSDFDSVMDGKGFLAKVNELHGVDIKTSSALMVSLMKKRFYQIIGKKSGQNHTTIKLQERGKRYLTTNGLYSMI